jgi:aminopeptidase-like protein
MAGLRRTWGIRAADGTGRRPAATHTNNNNRGATTREGVVSTTRAHALAELHALLDVDAIGDEMYDFAAALYPICRSITGDGVRATLANIADRVPLTTHEVPSGTRVFDWTVPPEWNVREAWVKDASGRRVIDFAEHNLHVVGYSQPVHTTLSRAELAARVFTAPERPDWVPYRTAYYENTWGFCASERVLRSLPEGYYEVCIDATVADGSLTYGECVLEGYGASDVLLSCHVCHPSLANDNLSGIALATFAAELLRDVALRHTYRFVFIPGTIGSVTWLARNEAILPRITAGLVLSGVGDRGGFTYKRSRRGNTAIDVAVEQVLSTSPRAAKVVDFYPYGYDERQYCSPGFDLPVGRLSRTPPAHYAEYHTSADDLSFISPAALGDSLATLLSVIEVLEYDTRYMNLNPKCEPQLGRRGLHRAAAATADRRATELAMLWVLNLSDGEHSLLDIARRSTLPFTVVRDTAWMLEDHELLQELP